MAEMRILNSDGDTRLTWEVEDAVAVKTAAKAFAQEMLNGCVAFSLTEPKTVIQDFDPSAEDVVAEAEKIILREEKIVVSPMFCGG